MLDRAGPQSKLNFDRIPMATAKKSSGPRERITPHKGDTRLQRRNPDGTLSAGDKLTRSQPADKAHQSKTEPPKNQGDKGDYQKPAAKKTSAKKA